MEHGSMSAAATKACPVCGKPAAAAVEPFCCHRCADVDLGRWLTGQYAIPAGPDEDDARQGEAAPAG